MKKDSVACFDIKSKIFNRRQGILSIKEIFKFLHGLNSEYDLIQVQILGKEKLPSLSENEETQQSVMFDKENSNTRSTMVTRKSPTKRSISEGKSFTKSSREKYCMYYKRPGHIKDVYYKLYGKEKVLKQIGENKGSTQMWVNQTTSDKENVVEHPSTSQPDQDI
ncbi:hypothetical protein CR513_20943, partial [Mucuna pruriens]